jgi:hypothetical protein
MFFYIGTNCPIQALNEVQPNLFLDKGWKEKHGIWYKGYSTDCRLEESLLGIVDGYKPNGKWCAIYKGQIFHPTLRGFPINSNGTDFTNIKLNGFEPCMYEHGQTLVIGSQITLEEASIMIGDILVENTTNFYRYNDVANLTFPFSAGLDTLTCWAILEYSRNQDYKTFVHLFDPSDDTFQKVMGTRREYESDLINQTDKDYWGYTHSSWNRDTSWYISGYYAETFQYRDGEAINALANYQGKLIDELASENDYLYWFLKRPSLERYKQSMLKFENDIELKQYLFNTIFYDHQMWHLDNNIVFSPFFDIRIPKVTSRLSIEDLTANCLNGIIQLSIIQCFCPELLPLLSDYKNEKDIWVNFRKNIGSLDPELVAKIIYT